MVMFDNEEILRVNKKEFVRNTSNWLKRAKYSPIVVTTDGEDECLILNKDMKDALRILVGSYQEEESHV